MKSPFLIAVISIVLVASVAAYIYWENNRLEPAPVLVQAPPPPLKPEVRQMIDAPPLSPPLPALAASDNFTLDILADLVGNKSLMKFFHSERVIHNIVATIDNLPSNRAPMSVMPVEQAPGKFVTTGTKSELSISPENAARYTHYVRIADAINAKKLVEVYVRLYPLFQQAYEELGYPNKYFNDRLIETIDNMLETPVINEPIRLVQPNVLYQFADPDLEGHSMGQKILMRTGSKNEEKILAKLREIKLELKLHMHEKKVERVG
jgi:hypothetical protein